jgi:hypothetical protein
MLFVQIAGWRKIRGLNRVALTMSRAFVTETAEGAALPERMEGRAIWSKCPANAPS